MNPQLAKRILAKRKANGLIPGYTVNVLDSNFPQQSNFIKDPARLKTLFCTRRAAKSYTCGLYMIHEALSVPGCNALFIGLTRASAKGIIWKDILKVINRQFKLKAKFNLAELTMTLPNGSMISCTGADADEEEMNKLLGRKYRLVCIDEGSMYQIDLERLIYGVLKPATADLNGTICLAGTSSNYTRGLFYEITTGKRRDWSVHHWTAHDNPYIAKNWQIELDEIDRDRPLFKETPLFKQWYLNQWVIDTDKLVYKYNPEKNLYKAPPAGLSANGWTYTLGVDLGWEDDNAFVLSMFHEHDMAMYVVSVYREPKMTFDQVTLKIHEYLANPFMAPSRVIIDGANKQGVESMRQRSNIPFEYADKTGKTDFIEMLNADLIQAKIKIHQSCDALINEMMGLVWKTDGDKIVIPKVEHPNLPNHLCDAFLYGWRNSYHYHSAPKEIQPAIGSNAWYQKQADNIWERERERLVNESQQGGWPAEDGSGGWPSDTGGMF